MEPNYLKIYINRHIYISNINTKNLCSFANECFPVLKEYQLCFFFYKNNIFNLNQSGSDNLFQISDINNINDYKIIKSKENFPGNAWPNDITKEITKDLKCISYPQDLSDERGVIIEGETEWRCNELWYKGKLIFLQKQEWPWPILEIEVDENDNFMILNISNGAYDPTDVYLVSLK